MNENIERDTQFAGFAKLLWEEDLEIALGLVGLEIKNKNFHAHIQKIIARRAYDLAVYVIHMHTAIERLGMVLTPADVLREMPDMIECPEETK